MKRTTKLMAVVCAVICAAALGGCGSDGSGEYESSSSGSGEPGTGLNGCDLASAEDHTGETALTIVNDGFSYAPACVRVSIGTTVTFASNFASHPLSGGDVETRAAEDGSPIQPTSSGTEAAFTFASAGAFGFYCEVHEPSMAGAVFVE